MEANTNNLGAECHFRPNYTPVCAITTLKGDILAANYSEVQGPNGQLEPVWFVSSAKVVVTRFWSSSKATVVLACSDPNIDQLPPFLSRFFRIEQDICIYMGYLDSPRPVKISDLGTKLLRVYVGVLEIFSRTFTDTGGITINLQARDRVKWLMDSDVTLVSSGLQGNEGFDRNISTLGQPTGDGGSRGVARSDLIIEVAQRSIGQVSLTNQAINNALPGTETLPEIVNLQAQIDAIGTPTTDAQFRQRDQLVSQLNDAVASRAGCQNCGKQIRVNRNYFYDAAINDSYTDPEAWFRKDGPLSAKVRQSLQVAENPEMRLYVTRQRINLMQQTDFLVMQKIAIEIIKYLALQEVYPTEFFQSNVDGHYYYVPRLNDTSGLNDKERFYRTYYMRNTPDNLTLGVTQAEVPLSTQRPTPDQIQQDAATRAANIQNAEFFNLGLPDPNQMLIRYKEEFTSVAMKTNLQVRVMGDTDTNTMLNFAVHLRAQPFVLASEDPDGTRPKFACKVYSWQDDTISSLAEAAVVALNLARQLSREVRAATGVLLGDPSLTPGEICQVVAPPLYETQSWLTDLQTDRRNFLSMNNNATSLINTYTNAVRGAADQDTLTLPVIDGSTATFTKDPLASTTEEDFLCRKSSYVQGQKELAFNKEPESIWRVEAVIHNFMSGASGYRTEVAWVSGF